MRSRLSAVAIAIMLCGSVAPPAFAAAPDVPSLVAPADGSTASGTDVTLSVNAADADGDALDVRFEGRKVGAGAGTSGEPFTIVAIPDTQNYTYSGRQATIVQQAQWVVDTRTQLNTAMAVQLGDLVSNYDNLTQWGHTSTGFRVMDDAGMPNTVTPGNHDFQNSTGDATQYNTYFGPSRYAGASWTPATARYGGYLGQNLFGTDPIDRGNMDNFALFTAGGHDFLVLNLEWEAPQYALDWGAKVLAAHPDRTAILVTHAFVLLNGQRKTTAERPGGTPTERMWSDFVAKQCTIRLVLNGHVHTGDLGEARRSDANQCGNQVPQILSDYQDRANGGNGWLRYYTVDPTAATLTATTYSPTLATYETDADSAFTTPIDLVEASAPFTPIATEHLAAPGTATTTWTGLDPDTAYEWRAVVADGSGTTTSPTWTVRTPSPVPTEIARDTFTRTGSRWGTAEVGGAWTDSGASYFATDGSYGQVTVSRAGSGPSASLSAVSALDVAISTDFALAATPAGGAYYHSLSARTSGTTFYQLATRVHTNGALLIELSRSVNGTSTILKSLNLTSFGYTGGERLRIRFDVHGTSPTTLAAKAWRASQTEPANPQVTATDATAALQGPGALGLRFYTASGTTSLPTRVSVDGFQVLLYGGTPPVNQPPVAAFTATPTSRTVALDAATSTDDGTITSYAWTYGDGTTGTGRTASHTYTADGDYTVGLTVTDNQGATASTTRQVSVANAAPTASFTATPDGLTVAVNASASSDDGTITDYAWSWGDGTTGTGRTASHPYGADGTYTVELTVTDDLGRTGTASRQVTVSAPVEPDELAADAFARSVGSGWGTADVGGAWTLLGAASRYSVSGGVGQQALTSGGSSSYASLAGVSSTATDLRLTFAWNRTASAGTLYGSFVPRRIDGNNDYRCKVVVGSTQAIQVQLVRRVGNVETVLAAKATGLTLAAGQSYALDCRADGSGTTQLAAKLWRAGTTEPAAWQATASDTTAALQVPGGIGINHYLSSGASSGATLSVDDLVATDPND